MGKRTEMELPCALSDEEMHSRSMMLVETVNQKIDTSAARTVAMKEFKDRLTAIEERQRELSNILSTGIEKRMVQCVAEFHSPVEATKRITRLDTGEVVKEEAMSAAECQLHMFGSVAEFERYMREQTPPADAPETGEAK
jgi:hypothetical protein